MDKNLHESDKPNVETQLSGILYHLLQGGKLTGIEALYKFGTICLPRQIKDLKEKGITIQSNRISIKKSNGKTARIAEYFIEKSKAVLLSKEVQKIMFTAE